MSEPIFSQPGAAAPAVAEPEQAPSGGNRKALLAVGGVVAALAVGAGAFFFLTGSSGGDDLDGALAPVKPKASAPAVDPSPAASAPATTVKVKPAKVTARDPFVVLFPDPEPSAAASQPAASGDGTTTPVVQPQTTSYVVNVTAIDPAAGTAKIKIGDKGYSATVGEQFAPYFTLYAVFNEQCVGVLFGDQNVPVCKGTPATVTQ